MEKEYKILKIDQLTRMSDLGGTEPYYRYLIKTKGGTRLSVLIDREDFTPEKSAPLLLAEVLNADKILKM